MLGSLASCQESILRKLAGDENIILVTGAYPGRRGGAAQYDHQLLQGLAELGYRVFLVFGAFFDRISTSTPSRE